MESGSELTMEGLIIFHLMLNNLKVLSHSRLLQFYKWNMLSDGSAKTAHGQIWIASDDGGLNRYSPKDRKFVLLSTGLES